MFLHASSVSCLCLYVIDMMDKIKTWRSLSPHKSPLPLFISITLLLPPPPSQAHFYFEIMKSGWGNVATKETLVRNGVNVYCIELNEVQLRP